MVSTALARIEETLAGVEMIWDPAQVAKLSSDYHTFSPILVPQLTERVADVVARPADLEQLRQVVAYAAQHGIPITIRGAGTGNYGQAVPLQGGVVVDMTKLNQVLWVKGATVRVQAGAKLAAIDKVTRESGWELRMAPSTIRTATIGGFIAGGSGGMGSVTYGQLRDRGNILALQVMTVDANPQLLELRGDDVYKVSHAWGTNGIITEVELPLAPAYPWAESVVAFPDFMQAMRFAQALSDADGILKKLVSVMAWPIPSYFTVLKGLVTPGSHAVITMIAEPALAAFADLVREWQGQVIYEKTAQEANKGTMLVELTWNHTTLHARTVDPTLTYLQSLFPWEPDLATVEKLYHHFGDEVMMHLEWIRVQGKAVPVGLQLVRFSTPERLNAIMAEHEANGVMIANPHTYIIEDGGRKVMDPIQVAFKEQVDPQGLLNPGKMRTWADRIL
ncbi:MAG: FAD-binding oxidoreductase [Synechococcales cyanobacterium]